MSLDLPILRLSNFKKTFYYFLAFNVIQTIVCMLLVAISGDYIPGKAFFASNSSIILLLLLFGSFAFSWKSKRELKSLLEIAETKEQFSKYEEYYRKKLIWNSVSIAITGLFFIMTEKNMFFYILIIQSFLSLAFYPTKRLLRKELNNPEIMFI